MSRILVYRLLHFRPVLGMQITFAVAIGQTCSNLFADGLLHDFKSFLQHFRLKIVRPRRIKGLVAVNCNFGIKKVFIPVALIWFAIVDRSSFILS